MEVKLETPLKMIASISSNRGIGYNGGLLFKSKEDMAYFKKMTNYSVVIMGRATWESLPVKPLKNRANIVLSSSLITEDAQVVPSIDSLFLFLNSQFPGVSPFVIGGQQLYEDLLPYTNMVYLTEFEVEALADRTFPELPESDWDVDFGPGMSEGGLAFKHNIYTRKNV